MIEWCWQPCVGMWNWVCGFHDQSPQLHSTLFITADRCRHEDAEPRGSILFLTTVWWKEMLLICWYKRTLFLPHDVDCAYWLSWNISSALHCTRKKKMATTVKHMVYVRKVSVSNLGRTHSVLTKVLLNVTQSITPLLKAPFSSAVFDRSLTKWICVAKIAAGEKF
jgi:hypothetical protein